MIRILLYIAVLLTLSLGTSATAGDAGQETPFALGVGARSLGMGGGFTTLATDATAIYYNPSCLSNLEFREVAFTHAVLFEGTMYDFASWVVPVDENHGIGVGYMRLGTDDIVRRVNWIDNGEFSYSYSQFLLSYGRNIGEPLSLGVSLKIINQSLDNKSDFGVGIDAGFTLALYRHLSLGAIARNLLPAELKLEAVTEKSPRSVVGGISVDKLVISRFLSVTASVDLEKFEKRKLKVHTGGELVFYGNYFLRCGYDRDNLVLGTGLKYGRVNLDYAYKLVDYVDDTHHFSLSFLIGKSIPEQIRLRQLAGVEPELTEEEKQCLALNETGDRFFRRFLLDSALVCYRQALTFCPTDQETIEAIYSIENAQRSQLENEEGLIRAERELMQTLQGCFVWADRLRHQGDYLAALDLLDLIFDLAPDYEGARELEDTIKQAIVTEIADNLNLGHAAVSNGHYVEAIEAFSRVLKLDSTNNEAAESRQQVLATMDVSQKKHLGIDLFEKGHFEDARSQFQDILSIDPNEVTSLKYIERINEMQTQTSTLEDIQRDRQYWSLYLEGIRHMRNGDYQQAVEVWERVLKAYPNNQSTLDNLEQARLRIKAENSD